MQIEEYARRFVDSYVSKKLKSQGKMGDKYSLSEQNIVDACKSILEEYVRLNPSHNFAQGAMRSPFPVEYSVFESSKEGEEPNEQEKVFEDVVESACIDIDENGRLLMGDVIKEKIDGKLNDLEKYLFYKHIKGSFEKYIEEKYGKGIEAQHYISLYKMRIEQEEQKIENSKNKKIR